MTWRQGFWLGFVFFAGVGVACAGAPKAGSAPSLPSASSVSAQASAEPVTTAAPEPAASSSEPLALVPASDAPPAAPAVLPICRAKCDKLVSKCSVPQVESCRLNCTKYDPPPAGCVAQVRAALECARDAPDLTCAHVAPESCTGKFREIAACSAGETAQKAAPAPAGLPAGWERIGDAAAGFSLALPRGSTVQDGPDGPLRTVTAEGGTIYTVSVLPPLKEKPSEKSLLHFLMKAQGRCSDKVKLDGFIEKADRSSIHFTAHCPDKTDWNGMIYIGNQHLIMLSAQAKAGKIGPTEPFFYQFEFGNR